MKGTQFKELIKSWESKSPVLLPSNVPAYIQPDDELELSQTQSTMIDSDSDAIHVSCSVDTSTENETPFDLTHESMLTASAQLLKTQL